MCVLQVIVAVLLPPLAVLWKRGLGASFVLNALSMPIVLLALIWVFALPLRAARGATAAH